MSDEILDVKMPPPPPPAVNINEDLNITKEYSEDNEQQHEEENESSEDEPDQYGQHQQIFHKLTAGEIRAIQRDAIQDYDQLRKMRKQKTQQILAAQEQERQMRSNMREVNVPDNDPWSSAFNFS